jgi:hypothetical protein
MTGHSLALDDLIINSIDTLILEGHLLSWYIMDTRSWHTEMALSNFFWSEVSHSCHGPIPGQDSSFKYQYKSFKRAFNKFKDPIQESSQDWPIVLLYVVLDHWFSNCILARGVGTSQVCWSWTLLLDEVKIKGLLY